MQLFTSSIVISIIKSQERIMRDKSNRIIFALLTGLILVAGCSSTAVKRELVNVRADSDRLSGAVVQKKDDGEKIHPAAYNFYINGLIYEGIGNIVSAAESYKRALQYHPDSYQFRYTLANSCSRLRRFDDVLAVLEVISPVDEDVYVLRGVAYLALGKEDSAKMTYRELIDVEPDNSMAYSHLAGLYRKSGDADSLIWAYENLTRIRPDNERHWRELGRLNAQKGNIETAKSSFQKSIKVRSDPTNILSYIGLAEVYNSADLIDSAIIIYLAAAEVEPNNIVVNRELAVLYARLDSLELAIPYARKVVELSPLDRTGVRRLGIFYFALDSLRLADSIFTYLVHSGERHSLNHFYLGRIAVLNDDYQGAVEEFTVLTQLADSIAEGWLDLGYAYRQLKQPEKEIMTYKTGLNHMYDEGNEQRLLFALGAAYERSGRIEIGVATFEEIIAKSPDYAQALNYLGYMLADRGERLLYAKDLIERAVEISPDNVAYLDSYGWVLYRLGQFGKALIHLKRAVTLDSDPIIFDHLGDAFKAVGDLEKAAIWWQKALELAPDNEQIREKLGI